MQFFVPHAEDDDQAERIYQSITTFVDAPSDGRRIWKLMWKHDGANFECEVGGDMPAAFSKGHQGDKVFAIFQCEECFVIISSTRGLIGKSPFYVVNDIYALPTYFD